MKRKLSPLLFTVFAGTVLALGHQQSRPAGQAAVQEAEPVKQPQPSNDQGNSRTKRTEDEPVRISVTLVQVDAVVTDKQDKQVTDLKPSDFEIFEDNRRQQITNFSFVSAATSAEADFSRSRRNNANVQPGPPVRLRPEQVQRTIVLVVDDLGMSFESVVAVRESLKNFVDEQMHPGDLVAIIRTGAGMGALQQFTTDKRMLNAAIERVRFNLMSGGGLGAFAPIGGGFAGDTGLGAAEFKQVQQAAASSRGEAFAAGTLGAVTLIVNGLRDFPGRKSVVLFSEGFRLFTPDSNLRAVEMVRRIIDAANRASVVVYTIDVRGLQYDGLTAADNTAFLSTADVRGRLSERRNLLVESQGGLNYLATQTGGLFLRNSNNISQGIGRVLEDQKGYYLLGYVPDQSTFKPSNGQRTFHRISVKVKRPGLRVRSRTGFLGVTDEEMGAARTTASQQIVTALTSPFASGDIHLKLTSLFGHEQKAGAFMRSITHIDARDVSFSEEEDGFRKGSIDIVAFTFGDNGQLVGKEARTYNLSVRSDGFQKLLDDGFIYAINVPIEKAGGYQLRVAVRDGRAGRVGSANQFIDVPDIGMNRLTLSGLVISGFDPSKTNKATDPGTVDQMGQHSRSGKEGAVHEIEPAISPAVRMLRRGIYLDYGFLIYNAQLDAKTGKPQLESQLILLKDGKPVFVGKVSPLIVGEEPDLKHIPAAGRLRLGDDLVPGEYVLQIMITDKLAKQKYRTAMQWMDFEITK